MADIFFNQDGGSSPDGSRTNPYAGYDNAAAAASSSDDLVALDGNIRHPSGEFLFNDEVNDIKSDTYRGATLLPHSSETDYVARTNSSTPVLNQALVSNLVIDAEDNVTAALLFGNMASSDLDIQVRGCEIKNATTRCLDFQNQRGKFLVTECKISGKPTTALIGGGSSLANTSDISIIINGIDLIGETDSNNIDGIQLSKINNTTNNDKLIIKNVSGTMDAKSGTNSADGIVLIGWTSPSVVGSEIKILGDQTTAANVGISFAGLSASLSNPRAENNRVYLNGLGTGIGYSLSGSDDYVRNFISSSNFVHGVPITGSSPQNFLYGSGTTGQSNGDISFSGHHAFRYSETTTHESNGNIAFDNAGSQFLATGCTACNITNGVAIQSGSLSMAASTAMLHVAAGGGNTVSTNFTNMTCIVSDISKIQNLAIKESSQVCQFTDNVYIIPDTVDISTTNLFQHNGADHTFSEWIAESEVSGDYIVQLPKSQIDAMIADYRKKFDPFSIQGSNTTVELDVPLDYLDYELTWNEINLDLTVDQDLEVELTGLTFDYSTTPTIEIWYDDDYDIELSIDSYRYEYVLYQISIEIDVHHDTELSVSGVLYDYNVNTIDIELDQFYDMDVNIDPITYDYVIPQTVEIEYDDGRNIELSIESLDYEYTLLPIEIDIVKSEDIDLEINGIEFLGLLFNIGLTIDPSFPDVNPTQIEIEVIH